jgi:DNA-binding MltR family transcriptional regulator
MEKEYVKVEKNEYHDMVHFIQTVCELHKDKKSWDKSLDAICERWKAKEDVCI